MSEKNALMPWFVSAAACLLALACSDSTSEPGGSPGDASQGGTAPASGVGGGAATAGSGGVPDPGGTAGGSAGTNPGVAGAANGAGGAAGGAGTGAVAGAGGSGGAPNATGGAGGSAAGSGGSGGDTNTEPTFHVFLLLGQSNMAGYAKAQAADKVKDERIRVLGFDNCAATGREENKWDVAVPPLHECWNGAVGPGDHFAKTLIEKLPPQDTIGLVPCAVSGEKIETFQKVGGSKYQWIIDRAKLAQQAGGVIKGFLFHQGESNCTDMSWPQKVKTLVTDLRNDLGVGEVPFLAGELPYSGNCSGHNPLVNELPQLIPNAHVVSAMGLAVDPADTQWNLHFDHDSTVTLGKRYATKMIEVLGL